MRYLFTLAVALCCAAEAKELTPPVAPVPAAIRSADLLQGRVNAKARVYYLLSGSSQNEVLRDYGAGIAKLYRQMKGNGAELVWLSKESPTSVLKWTKKVGLRCPVLPESKRSEKLPFPYVGEHIPPYLVALDAEGRKLSEANHMGIISLLSEWRSLVAEIERKEKQLDGSWDDEVDDIDMDDPAPDDAESDLEEES